jgi:hypothetical protein
VLDLVQPRLAGRRLRGLGRQARRESYRARARRATRRRPGGAPGAGERDNIAPAPAGRALLSASGGQSPNEEISTWTGSSRSATDATRPGVTSFGSLGSVTSTMGRSGSKKRISHLPSQPGADKVDSAEGMATLEAMSSHHNFRPGQRNKLVSEPPIAAPDEHAQLVEADQRFQAALDQAIAAGGERVEAMQATVHLKRRTKLSL